MRGWGREVSGIGCCPEACFVCGALAEVCKGGHGICPPGSGRGGDASAFGTQGLGQVWPAPAALPAASKTITHRRHKAKQARSSKQAQVQKINLGEVGRCWARVWEAHTAAGRGALRLGGSKGMLQHSRGCLYGPQHRMMQMCRCGFLLEALVQVWVNCQLGR